MIPWAKTIVKRLAPRQQLVYNAEKVFSRVGVSAGFALVRTVGDAGPYMGSLARQRLTLPPGGRWICFHCPREGQ